MRGEEGEASGVNGGSVFVCMCEPTREQRGQIRRQKQRDTNKLCVCGLCCHSLYTEAQSTTARVLLQTIKRNCIKSC